MTVRKSSVLQRPLFKLTRKSSGRCAIFLHLSELKESSCQYHRRVVDTEVYHYGEVPCYGFQYGTIIKIRIID